MPTVPRRRNGIVRVPKLWVDAATEAFFDLQAKGGGSITIPLPLKPFPYPKIREELKAIYPQKFVPLFFKVGVISAEGSTGTKSNGGYPVAMSINAQGASAVSTIYHELRHVVQYLGDEVVKTKSGTFGRPSRAATRSLRARKKAIKSGKIKASGFQAYLSGASEWQPWIGSTADKIVGKILAGNLTATADVNAAIRKGILGSTFYAGTDPATRKELMKQVYKEIMRQLRGYTDVVPAKHPKIPASTPTPPPPAPGTVTPVTTGAYTVRVKVMGASPSIANEPNYTGKDSKGRDKLEIGGFSTEADALAHAQSIAQQAKSGVLFHGGTIYAVRVPNGKGAKGNGETEVYVAGDGPEVTLVKAGPGVVGYGAVMSAAIKAAKKAAAQTNPRRRRAPRRRTR